MGVSYKPDVSIFGAPSFIEVANWIQTSYKDALESAPLSEGKRDELYDKYLRVWDILGEDIKLDSDQLLKPQTQSISWILKVVTEVMKKEIRTGYYRWRKSIIYLIITK